MKTLGLVFLTFTIGMPIAFPAFAQFRDPIGPYQAPDQDPSGVQERSVPDNSPPASESGEIQERGLKDKFKGQEFKRQPQLGGTPPAHLCHTETLMMTQCKCFNQKQCKQLTELFPNSCAAGSTQCEFVPMRRGPLPPLPPNLCGYQTPLTFTKCSCGNATECKQLTPFCPNSCPAGSQSCTCGPMQRQITNP